MRWKAIIVVWMTFIGSASAAEGWNWHEGPSSYVAGTANERGDTFAEACYPGERKCYWLVGLKQSCRTDAAYPVLVNTDAGAKAFRASCNGRSADTGLYQYAINEFDDIDNVVSRATRIGFALPLQGDQFLLIRFDLHGAKATVEAMRKAARARMEAGSR